MTENQPMQDDAFYFGCYREAGHYLWAVGPRRVHCRALPVDFPLPENVLDAGLLPPGIGQVEGQCTYCRLNGWTIISFWDRSLDTRPGCNSSFLLHGNHSFDDMLFQFGLRFPDVYPRFKFPLVLRQSKAR